MSSIAPRLRYVELWGIVDGRCACLDGPSCRSPGKHPVHRGWQTRSADPAAVLARGNNLGLIVPAGLLVLDVDPRNGGDASLADLEARHGPLPETPAVVTGSGGLHYYFAVQPTEPIVSRPIAPGLDIKAPGTYVATPPSTHISGRQYRWLRPLEAGVANCPGWLLDLITRPATNGHRAQPLPASVPPGQRNTTLASLAGTLRRRGLEASVIEPMLQAANERLCAEPLSDVEVSTIARSIGRYAAPVDPPATDLDAARLAAQLLSDRLRFAPSLGWLSWDGRRWRPVSDERALVLVAEALEAACAGQPGEAWAKAAAALRSQRKLAAVLRLMQGLPELVVLAEKLDADPWLLNLENGTLALRTGRLRAHDPADLLTQIAGVAYDPEATCPRWEAHLERFLPDPDLRRQFQRLCGQALVGEHLLEEVGLLHGQGANAKTTTIGVVQRLLGEYAWSAPPSFLRAGLERRHPAELAQLRSRRLVVVAELGDGTRLDEAALKLLAGGEHLTARRLYRDFETLRPTWTLAVVTNSKPKVKDPSEGFWRRLRVIPWTVRVPEAERRPQPEVIAEVLAEAAGILNWMIAGLHDVLAEPGWVAAASLAATESYRMAEDHVREFLTDSCTFGPALAIERRRLHEAYSDWCIDNGEKALSQRQLAQRLRDWPGVGERRTGQARLWTGIALKA